MYLINSFIVIEIRIILKVHSFIQPLFLLKVHIKHEKEPFGLKGWLLITKILVNLTLPEIWPKNSNQKIRKI